MLDIIQHEAIVEIRLARPPVNALNPELIQRILDAVNTATNSGARAIVLSGRSGMFSAGLDVPALLPLDRSALNAAWRDFFGLCAALACCPIPTVAAITGHSPAGGAVLSIFCDYRIMARGPFQIGLNEVQVGLAVPECIQYGLRRLIGTYQAERLLVSGAMLDSDHALALGLVDELVDVDYVVSHSIAWLTNLLKLPPTAMLETRRRARADLTTLFADPEKLPIAEFLEDWLAPETQATLHELVARLKSKK